MPSPTETPPTDLSRRGLLMKAPLVGIGGLAALLTTQQAAAAGNNYVCAYIFRRKPGMSLEDFIAYYETKHAPAMIALASTKGMLAYDHYIVRPVGPGDDFVGESGPAYDAISIYTFDTGENAHTVWNLPGVATDSQAFIDFSTMIQLPLTYSPVYPK